jgi:hypothetical protein
MIQTTTQLALGEILQLGDALITLARVAHGRARLVIRHPAAMQLHKVGLRERIVKEMGEIEGNEDGGA